MKRRNFLKRTSLIVTSVAGAIAGISLIRIFSPNPIGRNRKIKIGLPSDYPLDTYTLIEDQDIFVYRDHEGLQVVSSICTHLGCTVQRTTDGFECPCHGSCFADSGDVISGPAPRPLSWYSLEMRPDGKIQVDLDSKINPDYKYFIS